MCSMYSTCTNLSAREVFCDEQMWFCTHTQIISRNLYTCVFVNNLRKYDNWKPKHITQSLKDNVISPRFGNGHGTGHTSSSSSSPLCLLLVNLSTINANSKGVWSGEGSASWRTLNISYREKKKQPIQQSFLLSELNYFNGPYSNTHTIKLQEIGQSGLSWLL